MGVPALFRWLHNKYPKMLFPVIEEDVSFAIPNSYDMSGGNPNGFEIDNLYLDMNGIIHPCCHPEGQEAPPNEEAMFQLIFSYIDRIMLMVRPRHLLYMAIDGVAPRAKMNQQRSRRFRTAQEAADNIEAASKLKEILAPDQEAFDSSDTPSIQFDTNCITPGTSFMANLGKALQGFICNRVGSKEGCSSQPTPWSTLQVILSDSSVPGEGEHKIMDFIRQQQKAPGYPPNLTHAIYGLDADLIMLALATHEPNFYVLREDVFELSNKMKNICFRCYAPGHTASECVEITVKKLKPSNISSIDKKPFIWLSIAILREYLYFEFSWKFPTKLLSNFEALLDDWVFLIFFVGNDFLPHLPSLSIHEGAIDLLIDLYKKQLQSKGIFSPLTHNGSVNIPQVIELLSMLGKLEDKIFAIRKERESRMKQSNNSRKDQLRDTLTNQTLRYGKDDEFSGTKVTKKAKIAESLSLEPMALKAEFFDPNKKRKISPSFKESEKNLPCVPLKQEQHSKIEIKNTSKMINASDGSHSDDDDDNNNEANDNDNNNNDGDDDEGEIEFPSAEDDIKDKYYREKLNIISPNDHGLVLKKAILRSYLQGLCWVMAYYYKGCLSWNWFYPYHYAPFASDFVTIADEFEHTNLDSGCEYFAFTKGTPFRPFEQLLGVLPAASSNLLPQPLASLMIAESSPIADFYPSQFKIDLNGKKHSWQGVALLPFIDENRLLDASSLVLQRDDNLLSNEEISRNIFGFDLYFIGKGHVHYSRLMDMINLHIEKITGKELLSPFIISLEVFPHGIAGKIIPHIIIENMNIPYLQFQNPFPDKVLSFSASLLPGAVSPKPVVTFEDFRRSKFSKQTLRNSYPTSLLHHHHHSMHREYDDKIETNYAERLDIIPSSQDKMKQAKSRSPNHPAEYNEVQQREKVYYSRPNYPTTYSHHGEYNMPYPQYGYGHYPSYAHFPSSLHSQYPQSQSYYGQLLPHPPNPIFDTHHGPSYPYTPTSFPNPYVQYIAKHPNFIPDANSSSSYYPYPPTAVEYSTQSNNHSFLSSNFPSVRRDPTDRHPR